MGNQDWLEYQSCNYGPPTHSFRRTPAVAVAMSVSLDSCLAIPETS